MPGSSVSFKEYTGRDTRDVSAFNPTLEYNDQPFLPQARRWERTKHTTEHVYAEDLGELNALFDALVQEGSIPAAVWKLDPDDYVGPLGRGVAVPDFRVKLLAGEAFFVEITTAGESEVIRSENTLWDMSRALGEWFLATAEVQARLMGVALGFTPQRPLRAKDEKEALREMKDFALTEPLDPYKSFGVRINSAKYPILTQSLTLVLVQESSDYSNVEVHTPAGAFDPHAQYDTVLSVIRSKIEKGYERFRPIRLVVALQHVIGNTRDTFDAVKASLNDLGPFDRIYVANSNAALVALR